MLNFIKKNVWKIIIITLLCLNLVSTSWVIAICVEKSTYYQAPVERDIESYEELVRITDYLIENDKLSRHSFGFDYIGDDFDFKYLISAKGAKQKQTDIFELLSPKKCSAAIYGYVILNGYECGCPDYAKETESCLIREAAYPLFTVEKSECIITYQSLIGINEDFPDITDRSLLTVEQYNPDLPGVEYNTQYDVIYDGTPILRFSTCVPVDDSIISLFINHLVVFEQG